MRGLLPRSELPDELLDITPVFARAESELNTPSRSISLNRRKSPGSSNICVPRPTSGCWWTGLRRFRSNWQPTTQSTLSGENQSLAKLLDGWLEPLQLGYRVTDAAHDPDHQPAVARRGGEVEIYPLKGDVEKDATQLIQEFKQHIGGAVFVDGGGIGVVLLDPASRSLLTLLPQPQQRRVYEWLTTADKLRVATAARPQ